MVASTVKNGRLLNVAKCNVGEVKRETMLASGLHYKSYAERSWGLAGP